MAGGHQNRSLYVGSRQRVAVGSEHPLRRPFTDRTGVRASRQPVVEARRQAHLAAPAHALLPAQLIEEVRRRSQRIFFTAPQVDAAIAVAIHGVAHVVGRHELGMTHCARPGTAHLLRIQGFAIHHPQRGEELGGKIIAAPGVAGQGSQRIQCRHVAEVAAVVGFQPPERDQVLPGHAVALRQLIEKGAMTSIQLAPAADAVFTEPRVEVLAERLHEFRLGTIQLQHTLLLLHGRHRRHRPG